ncbi:MAG: phosphatidylserine decarboxylase [Lachnospiraceae bacterium]|nr:phosphatidylserine decarboxylase [Lachnospiraceae bacterium]
MSKVFYRKENRYIDINQGGEHFLDFMYGTIPGRMLLKLITGAWFSKLVGAYQSSFLSRGSVKKFIKKYEIDMSEFEGEKYKNFNDFFTRIRKKNDFDTDLNRLISPCDCKMTAYSISDDLAIDVKRSVYTLPELLGTSDGLDEFKRGHCLVFRLTPADYHHYVFVDDGEIIESRRIEGELHTVHPIAYGAKIFSRNTREIHKLSTVNFGNMYYVEVGALCVGKIVNRECKTFTKGEEKGYFKFGGSTVILLVKENIEIDADILEQSEKGYETVLRCGMGIGTLKNI